MKRMTTFHDCAEIMRAFETGLVTRQEARQMLGIERETGTEETPS